MRTADFFSLFWRFSLSHEMYSARVVIVARSGGREFLAGA